MRASSVRSMPLAARHRIDHHAIDDIELGRLAPAGWRRRSPGYCARSACASPAARSRRRCRRRGRPRCAPPCGVVVGVAGDDPAPARVDTPSSSADDLADHRLGALALLGHAEIRQLHLARRRQPARSRRPAPRCGRRRRRRRPGSGLVISMKLAMPMPRWMPRLRSARLLGAQRVIVHHRLAAGSDTPDATAPRTCSRWARCRDRRRRRSGCGARISTGSRPTLAAARSTSRSVTAQAIGWPTARYWLVCTLFWNTTASVAPGSCWKR